MATKSEIVFAIQQLYPRVTHRILDSDDAAATRVAKKVLDALNGAAAELGLPTVSLTKRVPDRIELGRLLAEGSE